jgi:chromosomal replication initiator protein
MQVNQLNPEYTFNTFIQKEGNCFAYNASGSVANNPSLYNPFIIYGKSGVGKTHLLHAIGNAIRRKIPEASIFICSAESFIHDVENHFRLNETDPFRNSFRAVDVLLVDDIQCVSGNLQAQNEFFQLINIFCATKRQLVFTSDIYPADLPGFGDFFGRVRKNWLAADIMHPFLGKEPQSIIKALDAFSPLDLKTRMKLSGIIS